MQISGLNINKFNINKCNINKIDKTIFINFLYNNMSNLSELDQKDIVLFHNIAKRVYNELGPGHNEKIYQKAMKYELDLHNIPVDMESHVTVTYCDSSGNIHNLESERIDLFIHANPPKIAELKAVQRNIQETEKVQIRKYFKELNKLGTYVPYGLLINFPQPNSKETRTDVDFEVVLNDISKP